MEALGSQIAARTGLTMAQLEMGAALSGAPPTGLLGALGYALTQDVAQRRHARRMRRLLKEHSVPSHLRRPILDLAAERRKLRQQTLLLRPFQRLFRYWHVVHLPLAVVMFLVLGVHVVVAVLFGYTWIL
jgi:hypothetical protein